MELDREQQEVAQTAARLIVEDGLDYASARRKAMQEHGEGGGACAMRPATRPSRTKYAPT
jgi:hypothetical protein